MNINKIDYFFHIFTLMRAFFMMRKLNIKHAIGTFTNRSKLRSRKE